MNVRDEVFAGQRRIRAGLVTQIAELPNCRIAELKSGAPQRHRDVKKKKLIFWLVGCSLLRAIVADLDCSRSVKDYRSSFFSVSLSLCGGFTGVWSAIPRLGNSAIRKLRHRRLQSHPQKNRRL